MDERRKPFDDHITKVVIIVLGFIGGLVVNTLSIADRVATKTYVDSKLDETKRYIDSAMLEMKQYSDLNRKSVQAELQTSISDVKSDVKAMIVKQDLMFDMMKQKDKK